MPISYKAIIRNTQVKKIMLQYVYFYKHLKDTYVIFYVIRYWITNIVK